MNVNVAVLGFTLKPITYTYRVPEGRKVEPGQLVRVPFGKKLRDGVVVGWAQENSPLSLKEIAEIKGRGALLTPEQLKLAEFIAREYFVSVAEAIHLMLPAIPNLEHQTINKGIKQRLILFPTFRQAETAAVGRGFLFSHLSGKKALTSAWQKVMAGEAEVIFGSRSALFAPYTNLKEITIYQTESDLYKEERRPYYRAFPVALELARLHGAKLRAISYSPRIEDEFRLPHELRKVPPPQVRVVNLREKEILNDQVEEEIKTASGRVLVFLNRKSEKGPLFCRTCRQTSYTDDPTTCPNCGGADVKFRSFNLQTLAGKIRAPAHSQITFATQQIFFQENIPFDLIVVLSADTYLGRAAYNASEKTFQMVTALLRLLKPGGRITIQTAYPEEGGLKRALESDYPKFYAEELKIRQETGYPPFSKVAKLIFASAGEVPEPQFPDLEVFGPFEEGKFPYFIVRGKDLSSLADLGRPWKLDIDPLSL